MMLLVVIAAYGAYLAFDFVNVARSGRRRHIWPWLAVFCLGLVIQVLYELRISVPSPAAPIMAFFSGLFMLE